MGKTMTSSISQAKMRNFKESMAGISKGMVVRHPFRPYQPPVLPRQADMDKYNAYPSLYNKVVDN